MDNVTDSDRVEAVQADLSRLKTELKKVVTENEVLIALAHRLLDDYRKREASVPTAEQKAPPTLVDA